MTTNYPQYLLSCPIAAEGDKTIPPETSQAAGTGRLSQAEGWTAINSKPIGSGGVPPRRDDFNGLAYLLSQFLVWYQQGGLMNYAATLPYEPGNEVLYNGAKYRCLQANGGTAAAVTPGSNPAVWDARDGAVRWDKAQGLDTVKQAQARANIDVQSTAEVGAQIAQAVSGLVAFDKAQSLNDAQQKQARANIGVYSKDEVDSAVSAGVGKVNSAFCRAFKVGESISLEQGGTRISVVIHSSIYFYVNGNNDKSRTFTVKLGGSSIGTVTIKWKTSTTGGAGLGRSLSLAGSGMLYLMKTVTKGQTLQVTGAAASGYEVFSEFAEVMVC